MALMALGSADALQTITTGTAEVSGGANNNGTGDFLQLVDIPGASTAPVIAGSAAVHAYITADLVRA